MTTLTPRLTMRNKRKKVAWTWLASANAPEAASEVRDEIARPTSPTRMPSSSSVKIGQTIEKRAGRGYAAETVRDIEGAV
jgi:hypothetical protein